MFRSRHAVGNVCARLAPLFAALTTLAPLARADVEPTAPPIDLEWDAPPECPGRDTVLAQIRRVLGDDTKGAEGAPRLSARVLVAHRDDGRWHVRIVVLGEPEGERMLDSASCSALTGATALVLAIRIKPNLLSGDVPHSGGATEPSSIATAIPPPPPPTPPAPPPMPVPESAPTAAEALPTEPEAAAPTPRPPEESRHGSLSAGATFVASVGELPSANAGAELEVAYERGRLRLELHGETGLVEDVLARGSTTDAGATFRAAGGGARACYGPSFGRLALFGCGDGQVDAMWANGHGFAPSFQPSATWVTLGALLGARYRLTTRLAIHAFVEALAPLARPTFITETSTGDEDRVVHQPSVVWGKAGLGVDVFFF